MLVLRIKAVVLVLPEENIFLSFFMLYLENYRTIPG
jgi:hypothetical protein